MTRRVVSPRAVGGLAAAAVLVPFALGLTSPSSAIDSRIGLSWDGTTWSSSLTGTLFNAANSPRVWVPGDGDTEHFFVRDQGTDASRLLVEYRLPTSTRLANAGDLEISARIGQQPWQSLSDGSTWLPVDRATLGAGDRTQVAVRAVFHFSSGDQSRGRVEPLMFRVTLTEDATGPSTPSPSPTTNPTPTTSPTATTGTTPGPGATKGPTAVGGVGPGPGGSSPSSPQSDAILPNTGSPVTRWLVALAALCVGAGLAAVGGSVRKGRRDD